MVKIFLIAIALFLLSATADAQVLDVRKIKNAPVTYVAPRTLKKYPTPVLQYSHDRAEYENLKRIITEIIIYPFLNTSEQPIAAMIVDFCPDIIDTTADDKRGCEEDRGNLVIGVTVKRHDGTSFFSLIERNAQGQFDKGAFLTLFPSDYKRFRYSIRSLKESPKQHR